MRFNARVGSRCVLRLLALLAWPCAAAGAFDEDRGGSPPEGPDGAVILTDGPCPAVSPPGSLPLGFTKVVITNAVAPPTAFDFTPDGRILIAQHTGAIRVYRDGGVLPEPAITLPIGGGGERGVFGLEVSPDFAETGYVYVRYVSETERNRLSRLTLVGDVMEADSEFVLWESPTEASLIHHGGGIVCAADGTIWFSVGDQAVPHNAQDLSSPYGKILRIGLDGTIPGDNPYLDVLGADPYVWAYGLRNPFRLALDEPTGRLWIGDVGGDGPSAAEEVNLGAAGLNFGWPLQVATECKVSDCAGMTPPRFHYFHENREYSSDGISASITLGPVYRGGAYPPEYEGNLFVGDFSNRWIRRLVLDDDGQVLADLPFLIAPHAGTIVQIRVGADGWLYYAAIGYGGGEDQPGVYRIEYSPDFNHPPTAVAGADNVVGSGPPQTVRFESGGSGDPDGDPLSFCWDFGDGATAFTPNPVHVYSDFGIYHAVLTVDDGRTAVSADPIRIEVGDVPVLTISQPAAGTLYRAGDVIAFSASAIDGSDGELPSGAFTWEVRFGHGNHFHPFFGPAQGSSGFITIPARGHSPEDTYFEFTVTVTDSDGLQAVASRAIHPEVSLLQLDTLPSGIPVFRDGQAEETPRAYRSVVNFEHELEAQESFVLGGVVYTFVGWSDGADRVRTLVAPPGGAALVARYEQAALNSEQPPDEKGEPAASDGQTGGSLACLGVSLVLVTLSGLGLLHGRAR